MKIHPRPKGVDELVLSTIEQVEYSNSNDGPIIHIFGRDPSGMATHLQVTGFRPYFYVPAEYVDEGPVVRQIVVDKDHKFNSIYGEALRKVYVNSPFDIRILRDRYHHYEADIPFTSRFMIDSGITGGVDAPNTELIDYRDLSPDDVGGPARVCIADIECSDDNGWPDARRDPIICLTAWDSFDDHYTSWLLLPPSSDARELASEKDTDIVETVSKLNKGNREVVTFVNERDLLEAFVEYIRDKDPDILTGWNFILFDLPYLLERMKTLKVDTGRLSRLEGSTFKDRIGGRCIFDLLEGYKKLNLEKKESYRLDAIAEAELGDHKLHFNGSIDNLWREDPATLVEYNWKDVEICVRLEQQCGIVSFHRELSHYAGLPLENTVNSSSIIDVYILRKANGRYVLPSKGFSSAKKFKGATVFEPSSGLKHNVIILDLKSLYPMAMLTVNASVETKDPDGEYQAPNGIRFKSSPDGLAKGILLELLKERDAKKEMRKKFEYGSAEYKKYDMQQAVVKIIMNTYYGVSGYSRFRLYDPDIGAAITSIGREILQHSKNVVESMGYSVIGGDSVAGDSKIKMYMDGKSSTVPISSLFTRVDYTSPDGKEYCELVDTATDTIDADGFAQVMKVPYVMRHRTDKKIYRVRLTNETYVDVTEDHSIFGLINMNVGCGKTVMERIIQLKPNEIGVKAKSLIVKKKSYNYPTDFMSDLPKEAFELLGYFVGDGSFNNIRVEKNHDGYLACGLDQQEVVDKIIIPLQNFGLIKSFRLKKKGDVWFNGKMVKILNDFSRKEGKKIIPEFIYTSSEENICHFLRGLFSSDGTCMIRKGTPLIRYCSILKKLCLEIQGILHLVGIASSVYKGNTPNSYNGIFSGTYSYYVAVKSLEKFSTTVGFIEDRKQIRIEGKINSHKKQFNHLDFDISSVQNVEEIEYSDYVYDIEVKGTHRFFANNVLVHNTDSIFVELGPMPKDEVIKIGRQIEAELNGSYQSFSLSLNSNEQYFSTKFEKIYERFFQAGKKKRYAGLLVWEEGKDMNQVKVTGYEIKRSDSPALTRIVQKRVIDIALNSKEDPYIEIKSYLGEIITKYRKGEYSLDEIGIPGGISKDLKEYEIQDAHVRGAIYANEYLGAHFGKASKPKRLYIRDVTGKYPRTDVIDFEYGSQVPPEFVVDIDLMLEKTLALPISRVIEALNIGWVDVDPSITKLCDFK